jgi:GxxExxY protein
VARPRIDMIVDGQVVVEVKAGETLSRFAEPQLCAYLAATSYSVGLLLHFGPAPRYRRIIYNGKRFGP